MCGIIGIVGCKEGLGSQLLSGIKRLEYRGYDSVGMAALNEGVIITKKGVGAVDEVNKKQNFAKLQGRAGIAHSRWATHGGVTEHNSHPHNSCDGNITIVHNGIIENFHEFKSNLLIKGHEFSSETDSEIIAHYFENELENGKTMKETCTKFMKEAKGTFAILLIKTDEDKIYALKRDSPLVLGIAEKQNLLASDMYAISDKTNKTIYFEDNEFAEITSQDYQFYDKNGKEIRKEPITVEWSQEEELKQRYPHYMLKEIKEQPKSSERLINSFTTTQKNKIDKIVEMIKNHKNIVFVACGTSYHASLIGAILLTKLGINARTVIASESETFIHFNKETLCIAISQSGETMDVISVLKNAKEKGAEIVSIVNVPHSTIQRLSAASIEVLAGQEVCVAATKTYTNQLITMFEIGRRLGYKMDLNKIPEKIQEMIDSNEAIIKKLASELFKKNDMFVIGRNTSYPIAREIALKLKEISYIHAEGMMGGELKHGTIALIEEGTPVIALIPNNNPQIISNAKEVEARGAKVIIITNTQETSGIIKIPESDDAEFAIYACVAGHLLSYYIAVLRGLPIDKPRNLAKCVTVK